MPLEEEPKYTSEASATESRPSTKVEEDQELLSTSTNSAQSASASHLSIDINIYNEGPRLTLKTPYAYKREVLRSMALLAKEKLSAASIFHTDPQIQTLDLAKLNIDIQCCAEFLDKIKRGTYTSLGLTADLVHDQ